MAVLHMPGAKTRLHLLGPLTQDQTHINVGKCLGCLSDRPLTQLRLYVSCINYTSVPTPINVHISWCLGFACVSNGFTAYINMLLWANTAHKEITHWMHVSIGWSVSKILGPICRPTDRREPISTRCGCQMRRPLWFNTRFILTL